MTLVEFSEAIIQFVRAHEHWAAPTVLVLAFLESFAFVSLIVPATVILFAISGLVGAARIDFWPVYMAAVSGAFAGDWLAYELAFHYKGKVAKVWPVSRYPKLLERGFLLFDRWGIMVVFIGRFFGPLRAAIPLVAGIIGMPRAKFQLANFGSAVIWAAAILSPAGLGMQWLLG
jgi:membrane protein DedA with SNARE-associated domain